MAENTGEVQQKVNEKKSKTVRIEDAKSGIIKEISEKNYSLIKNTKYQGKPRYAVTTKALSKGNPAPDSVKAKKK